MRILLYSGKGGVGTTSVAAATAVRCAELGYRTIVISTDSAHSLADSFEQALGATPTRVADNLWGQELDVLGAVANQVADPDERQAARLTLAAHGVRRDLEVFGQRLGGEKTQHR